MSLFTAILYIILKTRQKQNAHQPKYQFKNSNLTKKIYQISLLKNKEE